MSRDYNADRERFKLFAGGEGREPLRVRDAGEIPDARLLEIPEIGMNVMSIS